jgi:hypothetical protein
MEREILEQIWRAVTSKHLFPGGQEQVSLLRQYLCGHGLLVVGAELMLRGWTITLQYDSITDESFYPRFIPPKGRQNAQTSS